MLKDIPYVKKTAVEMKLYFASQMRSLMICALEEGRQTCRDNKSDDIYKHAVLLWAY